MENLETERHTLIDFSQPPKQLRAMSDDYTVTRDNFCAWLIESFRTSRGNLTKHFIFLEWLKAQTAFDYSHNLKNFFTSGGWDCLTSEEGEMFLSAFASIYDHKKEIPTPHLRPPFYTNPKLRLDRQLEALFIVFDTPFDLKKLLQFKTQYGDLKEMSYKVVIRSLADFNPYG